MIAKKDIEVSIVMAVRNESVYLQQCLSSITENGLNNYELIIVDDASTDDTPQILSRHKEKFHNIVLLNNKTPIGLAASLNRALAKARSDLILRIDGDDIMMNSRIFEQVTFMNDHKDIDVMGSNVTLIDGRDVEIGRTNFPESNDEIKQKLKKENVIAHPSVIFRKNSIVKIGGYDETFKRSQDYELWRRCLVNGLNFHNSSKSLVWYRYTKKNNFKKSVAQFVSYTRISYKYRDIKLLITAIITLTKNILSTLGLYRERSTRKGAR